MKVGYKLAAESFGPGELIRQAAVAAGGAASARIAAEHGDGLFATEPKPELVRHYREAGGSGPCYAEVPMAWAADEHTAAKAVLETSRWAVTGWRVMSELPDPADFVAATATVREEDILAQFALRARSRPLRRGRAAVRRRRFRPSGHAARRSGPGRVHRLPRAGARPSDPGAGAELTRGRAVPTARRVVAGSPTRRAPGKTGSGPIARTHP